ncbi:MAG: hypothetical protein ACOVLC_07540 [Flavobacterium sp.]
MEILDHLILKTESILENNSEISFEEAVVMAKEEEFGKKGFADLIQAKTKALNRNNSKKFNAQVKAYFTFPKVILTMSSLVFFYLLISFFEKPEKAALAIVLVIFIIGIIQLIPFWQFRKKNTFHLMVTDSLFGFYQLTTIGYNFTLALVLLGKESLDFNHIIIKLVLSLLIVFSLISLLIFIKIRNKTITELQIQIFI